MITKCRVGLRTDVRVQAVWLPFFVCPPPPIPPPHYPILSYTRAFASPGWWSGYKKCPWRASRYPAFVGSVDTVVDERYLEYFRGFSLAFNPFSNYTHISGDKVFAFSADFCENWFAQRIIAVLLCTNPLHAGYFFSFYFYVGLFFGAGISLTFFCVFTSLRLDIFSYRVYSYW